MRVVRNDPSDPHYDPRPRSAWVWVQGVETEYTDWLSADDYRRVVVDADGVAHFGGIRIEHLDGPREPAPAPAPVDTGFVGVFVAEPKPTPAPAPAVEVQGEPLTPAMVEAGVTGYVPTPGVPLVDWGAPVPVAQDTDLVKGVPEHDASDDPSGV